MRMDDKDDEAVFLLRMKMRMSRRIIFDVDLEGDAEPI